MIAVSGGTIRPSWLRPGALAAVAVVHVAAISLVAIHRADPPGLDETVEITIAQGMPEPEPPKPPEPEPEPPPPPPEPPPEPPKEPPPPPVVEPPPPPPPEVPPPEPLPEPPAPPKREVISAPVLPPPPPPKPKTPKPRPVETPPPDAAKPPATTGAPDAPVQQAQAKATYAAKVLQEIRAHRISTTGTGSVVVAFSIDAAGEITDVHVVRSSGRRELDSTAVRMVRAARPGPPPDGAFSATTTVNFVE